MALDLYFKNLMKRVEESEEIQNDGTDKNGFYLPTRTAVLRHLQLLRDLHAKPLAKQMVKTSWEFVVEHLPPEWLIPEKAPEQNELKKMLSE